ncbi:type I restriction endonuclease subunit R [Shinella sedimenti]|uniref:Type I restriction enzyme endonuclease subunit n=1 Tax=Shinella sedimenti TaxID=2919913 RepID=A0ABT0CLK2_9HYPH|nr:type I restriction endonuclease subunit R [Shinella sedimenti]MCJ8149486.1 type I restriction endonuclease subunit R [Shinella sedimenti]
MTQSEAELEKNLVKRLTGLGYEPVTIYNSDALLTNLRGQLSKHNAAVLQGKPLSEGEFEKVLNHLDKGNVFDRAKTLRDRFALMRDDGSTAYLQFINMDEWCRNEYQVTHQIEQEGTYKNRYDVTLLINGLPLVQVELKRRGIEMKEAFNQLNRYQRHSFWSARGLFNYVQIFVISNGVNTKYYANQRKQHFKQTFFWAKSDNSLITHLDEFADDFLEKCQVSKMICRYIVLQETDRVLMVLRPYQYYAVERIVEQVKTSRKNGYIWHTTGSGKTLTSFKAAQILTGFPKVRKVVFVVDRADLDYQTTREFNHFAKGSVDGTNNTRELVKQFGDAGRKLIVTTIQKLNNAVSNERYDETMQALQDERVVFIFDECHRSQFGETHKRITEFFSRAQMFGFTGTPIFADNAARNSLGMRTTKDLFGEQLHQYVITDAIRDQNVLKFSVEYWGKLKRKDGSLIDEKVAGIDTKEFFESPDRTEGIVDWIIANHGRKTHNRDFTAMMAVGSVDVLIQYYEQLQERREAGLHDLRVATIFTFAANEEDKDADGLIGDPDFNITSSAPEHRHSREKLDTFIADYNKLYGTNFSTKSNDGFYNYYKDIAKRVKERDKEGFQDKDRVDILLVVNMYLTGFDAKKVNTLYVDKNLRYHGLIQAYSRTNRILNDVKSQGNIVCFRNLKDNTDEAIALFSDKNANEEILIEPYEVYVAQFNEGVKELLQIAPLPKAVDSLKDENEQLAFIKAFRKLIRILNVLSSFSQFAWSNLFMEQQTFEDFKSKYLDLYDRTRSKPEQEEKASILDEVDFELELIRRDEINVAYILALVAKLKEAETSDDPEALASADQRRKSILDLLGSEPQLRSKRDLIEKFIDTYLPNLRSANDVEPEFDKFWTEERESSIQALCEAEGLKPEAVAGIINDYHFTQREPLRETIVSALKERPKILQRKAIIERVKQKLLEIIGTFDDR